MQGAFGEVFIPSTHLRALQCYSVCDGISESKVGIPQRDLSSLKGKDDLILTEAPGPPPFGLTPIGLPPIGLPPFRLTPFGLGLTPFGLTPFGLTPFRLTPFGLPPFGLTTFGLTPFVLTPFGLTSKTQQVINVTCTGSRNLL